jgi:hypothetical protein
MAIIDRGRMAFQSIVHTNNVGLLSDKRYETSRPKDSKEFRIAFLGDSLTGTTTMDFQWVDLVEDKLNRDGKLAAALGVDAIRTYNCGIPGSGFVAFWRFYDTACRHFDPDFVVVNYIETDFPRTDRSGHLAHTKDEEVMLDLATTSLDKIRAEGRPMILTLMPVYWDLYPELIDYHVTRALMERRPSLDVTIMHKRLDWQGDAARVRRWYNLPYDGHMSEIGGAIYAEAMARLLMEKLTDSPASDPPTRVGEKDAGIESAATEVRLTIEDLRKNLIADDLFEGLPDSGSPKTISGYNQVGINEIWSAFADGKGGSGSVAAYAVPLTERDVVDPAGARRALRFIETRVPSAGQASIATHVMPGWRDRRGETVDLILRGRAAGGGEKLVGVFVYAFYGDGAARKDESLLEDAAPLAAEWTTRSFTFRLPEAPDNAFGEAGTETLMLRFVSEAKKDPSGFDLSDIVLRSRGKKTGDGRRPVRVGDRRYPIEVFQELRQEINRRQIAARESSWKLYGLQQAMGRQVNYGIRPVDQPYVSGFEQLTLPSDPPEPVFIHLYCLSEPITLDNPDCYHGYVLHLW